MALHLKIVIVAEQFLEPEHRLFGALNVAIHDFLRHLATQAGRAADNSFVVLLQKLVVDSGVVVVALGEGLRTELAQVFIARFVLCQQDKVPAAGVFFQTRLVGAVGLNADDGLERFEGFGLGFQLLKLGLQLGLFCFIGLFVDFLLTLLDFLFRCAVHLARRVNKILDSEHVAVVSKSHGVHVVGHTLVYQIGHFRHSVEYRVVRVDV